MSKYYILAVLALSLAAQTHPKIDKFDTNQRIIPGAVYVLTPSGKLEFALLGPNLTLDCTAAPCVIRVTIPQDNALRVRTEVKYRVMELKLATYTLNYVPAELDVVRNGITLSATEDYDLSGQIITWRAGEEPQRGDLLRFVTR